MGPRALFTLLLAAAAASLGCVQRAILLPVLAASLPPSSLGRPAGMVADAPLLPGQDAPAAPEGLRYAIRAASSKLEVSAADISTGTHVLRFERWRGAFLADAGSPPERPSGRLVLNIDLTTLTTDGGVESFIKHDLLEVDRYPYARLVAAVRPRTDDAEGHVIQGRVVLHGVERAIRFHARVRKDGADYHIEAVFDMARRAFNVVRPDLLDLLIDSDFRVTLALNAHPEQVSAEVVSPEPPDEE